MKGDKIIVNELCHYLKPFDSLIKDSKTFFKFISDINNAENEIMVSSDVTPLYANILKSDMLNIPIDYVSDDHEFISKHLCHETHFSILSFYF